MDCPVAAPPDRQHVLAFNIANDPVAPLGAAEFTSGFEAGSITLFDRVLPGRDRVIDLARSSD